MYSSLKFWDFKPNFSSKVLNCHYLRLTIRGGGDDTEQHHFTLSRSFLRLYFVRLKKLLLYVILTQKYKKYFLNQTLFMKCPSHKSQEKSQLQYTDFGPQYYNSCCIIQVLLFCWARSECYLDTSAILLAKVNKLLSFSQQSNACIDNDSNFRLVNSADKYH